MSEILEGVNHERLTQFVARIVGQNDAEDVVQQAYLKAHKHAEHFQGTCKYASWVYQIARNEAITFLRRQIRHERKVSSFGQLTKKFYSPSDTRLELRDAQRKLMELPRDQRITLLVSCRADSYQDAAAELGITYATVKSRTHRARQRFVGVSS